MHVSKASLRCQSPPSALRLDPADERAAARTNEQTAEPHRKASTNTSSSIPPSGRSKVKSSVQRGLRQRFLEAHPGFEPYIEEILPKKAQLDAVKL